MVELTELFAGGTWLNLGLAAVPDLLKIASTVYASCPCVARREAEVSEDRQPSRWSRSPAICSIAWSPRRKLILTR